MGVRGNSRRDLLLRSLTAAAALTMAAACATQASTTAEAPLPRVTVVTAEHRDIPLEATYTGRIEAVDTVELRPRVSGALEHVLFREGSIVSRGTPLFRIDERPYRIALRRAEADVATIEAALKGETADA